MQTYGSRRQHAQRAGNDRSFVGENVTKHIFGDNNIETARPLNNTHGSVVHVEIFHFDIRILRCHFLGYLSPEARSLQHIGLVDHGEFLATFGGKFKAQFQDAFYFFATVGTGIYGAVAVFAAPLWTSEINAAGEFADA